MPALTLVIGLLLLLPLCTALTVLRELILAASVEATPESLLGLVFPFPGL